MVFSVLLKIGENVTHKGSGFVTNKKGLCITAAHVLLNHCNELENIRVAFPVMGVPSQLFKIKVLHFEYFDPIHAKGKDLRKRKLPFYQDLAICRILAFKYDDYYKIQRERPSSQEILTVKGFYNPMQVPLVVINNHVDISGLPEENTEFRIKYRLFSIFSGDDGDHEKNPDLVELEKKYNNCLTLKYAAHHGVSGGPIINSDNKVVGILLGGNQGLHYSNILCAKYIKKKYRLTNNL
jgi:hypothetical protein